MKQREVQGQDNTKWTCVQALSASESPALQEAAARVQEDDKTVTVVCTPSGGERSRRITLPVEWEQTLSDAQLLDAIAKGSEG